LHRKFFYSHAVRKKQERRGSGEFITRIFIILINRLKIKETGYEKIVIFSLSILLFSTSWYGLLGAPVNDPASNGRYDIMILKGATWEKVGSLSFSQFYREKILRIGALPGDVPVRIRIKQTGGGAAHIDRVLLDGKPPQAASGLDDPLYKLARRDNDVADAFGRSMELVFPAGSSGSVLTLIARVEAEEIAKFPFQFPVHNLFSDVNERSSFYTYRLGGDEPFSLEEYCRTGTGHPSGYTHLETWSDDRNLYVNMDFTPDNTLDGDRDYATVHTKYGNMIKSFTVSTARTKWGKPSFVYTDRAAYQHKVYDFAIPISEIGAGTGEEIQIAFSAYGTASPDYFSPALAYDEANNRLLMAWVEEDVSTSLDIYAGFLDSDGSPIDAPITICTDVDIQKSPRIAYNTEDGSFLVVWNDYRDGNYDIYGKLVYADGDTSDEIGISIIAGYDQNHHDIAYDKITGRFLVAWNDDRDTGESTNIYGQLVNSDGTLYSTGYDENFKISDSTGNDAQAYPAVSYDSTREWFFVVWQDCRASAEEDIYGQFVRSIGSLKGDNFVISEATAQQVNPTLAYDPLNDRFVVAWEDRRDYGDTGVDIYGRFLKGNGTFYGGTATDGSDDTLICMNEGNQIWPYIAYNTVEQKYLVVWEDVDSAKILGQYFESDSQYDGDIFVVSDTIYDQHKPFICFNEISSTFIMVYYSEEGPPPFTSEEEQGGDPIGDPRPEIEITPTTYDFGRVTAGMVSDPATFTVTNRNWEADLDMDAFVWLGDNAYQFQPRNNEASGNTIVHGEPKTFEIVFKPSSVGEKSASVRISSNDPDERDTFVYILGEGVNTAPSAPTLVYPEDGATGLGTEIALIWNEVADPDRQSVWYELYVSTDSSFADTTPVSVMSEGAPVVLGGFGLFVGLMAMGSLCMKKRKRRRVFLVLLIVLCVALGGFLLSCGGDGGGDGDDGGVDALENPTPGTGETSYTMTGLQEGTTYYWKVVTDDGYGTPAESEVRSFTTR